MKCNPDPVLIRALVLANNCGFDCASVGEMTTVIKAGANPRRIIYANPNKPFESIIFALRAGVSTMTYDGVSELDKIRAVVDSLASNGPQESFILPQVVLRIRVPDDHSHNSLG